MADKPYVGDEGSIIEVDMGETEDLTLCSTLYLFVKKPNGNITTWGSTVVSTTVFHTITTSGDFDISGIYKANPWGEFSGWKGRGETFEFEVFKPFK